jgi:hypothetical protein
MVEIQSHLIFNRLVLVLYKLDFTSERQSLNMWSRGIS